MIFMMVMSQINWY